MSFDLPYGGGGKGKPHNMANIIQNNPRLPITKNYSFRLKWLVDRMLEIDVHKRIKIHEIFYILNMVNKKNY